MKKTVFILLFLLLSLSACGKNEQENKEDQRGSQETGLNTEGIKKMKIFFDDEPVWLTQIKLEEALLGMKEEDVLRILGEPDHSPKNYPDPAMASITDDYYYLEDGWQVALGYKRIFEGEEELRVVSNINISNREKEVPLYYSYNYPVEDEVMSLFPPSVTLSVHESTFTYYWHPLSSYIGYGEYKVEGDTLILKTSDGKFQYCFTMDGENLVFHKENSSSTGLAKIPDGAVFVPGKNGFVIQKNETIEESGFGRYSDYQSLLRKKRESNLRNSN